MSRNRLRGVGSTYDRSRGSLRTCGGRSARGRSRFAPSATTVGRRWHKLVNHGAKTVRVEVELRVECTSVSTTRKPTTREYWVGAGESVELGKTRANSSCRRDYRVRTARYS